MNTGRNDSTTPHFTTSLAPIGWVKLIDEKNFFENSILLYQYPNKALRSIQKDLKRRKQAVISLMFWRVLKDIKRV